MKDKELLPILSEYTLKLLEHFRHMMFLSDWFIRHEWATLHDLELDILGETYVNETYLEATIQFDRKKCLKLYRQKKGYDLALLVAHELAHCHTHPLYEQAKSAVTPAETSHIRRMNEQLTQRFAYLAVNACEKQIYEIR